jgi:gliding motility-associated lipoprotein GldH
MLRMKKNCISYGMAILITLILTGGCNRQTVFQDNNIISSAGWYIDDTINFSVAINDTTQIHELYLMVRNTTDYPYRNLFIFLDIEFPDKRTLRDTIECILAKTDGQWRGKGFGKIRSNEFLFRDDVWFPSQGTYTFRMQHGMREEPLKGISDVGIRIQRK